MKKNVSASRSNVYFLLSVSWAMAFLAGSFSYGQSCRPGLKEAVVNSTYDFQKRSFKNIAFIQDWERSNREVFESTDFSKKQRATFELLKGLVDGISNPFPPSERANFNFFIRVIKKEYIPFALLGESSLPPHVKSWQEYVQMNSYVNFPQFKDPEKTAKLIVRNYRNLNDQVTSQLQQNYLTLVINCPLNPNH